MLLIAISFIYIFSICTAIGVGFYKLFKIETYKSVEVAFIGLFSISLLASIWAFWGRIHWEFHLFLILTSCISILFNKDKVVLILKHLRYTFKQLSPFLKALLISTAVLILMQCASAPYVIDNESYYIQTIAVLNDYGFIKGLANLHFFLAQTSGWHITQSALNLNFVLKNFNDLSGFCLLLTVLWSFDKLNLYFKNRDDIWDLIFGLFPLANLFFFQFIGTPSQDIPIYCLTFICISIFQKSFRLPKTDGFIVLCALVLFCIFIKPTSFLLIGFPIVLFINHYKTLSTKVIKVLPIALLTLLIFIGKNSIISGYPLFPLLYLDVINENWKLPIALAEYYINLTKAYGFLLLPDDYTNLTTLERLYQWLTLGKLRGIFNCIAVIFICITPFFIRKTTIKKTATLIFVLYVLQLIVLFFTSPLYRFYFNLLYILQCLVVASVLYKRLTVLKCLLTICILISGLPLIINTPINFLANNSFSTNLSHFNITEIVMPHSNSKFEDDFKTYKKGNLNFNHPLEIDFFWGTGNVPFPAVNYEQLNYFEQNFKVIPQLRTTELKDGFYSKTISND